MENVSLSKFTSNDELVTSGTNDSVVFVDLFDINLEFIDRAGAERDDPGLLHQPHFVSHFRQSFLSFFA